MLLTLKVRAVQICLSFLQSWNFIPVLAYISTGSMAHPAASQVVFIVLQTAAFRVSVFGANYIVRLILMWIIFVIVTVQAIYDYVISYK